MFEMMGVLCKIEETIYVILSPSCYFIPITLIQQYWSFLHSRSSLSRNSSMCLGVFISIFLYLNLSVMFSLLILTENAGAQYGITRINILDSRLAVNHIQVLLRWVLRKCSWPYVMQLHFIRWNPPHPSLPRENPDSSPLLKLTSRLIT